MSARRHDVVWTGPALRDLESLAYYIAQDSPANAGEVIEKMEASGASLCTFPKRGRRIPEMKVAGFDEFRECVVAPWRIIYRIAGKTVFILAVLDGRRDLGDILFERLTRA